MSSRSIGGVSLLRVAASQCIVWHHFFRYGPLARVLEPSFPNLVNVLANDLRHAVQVFLVLSGALLAYGLLAKPVPVRLGVSVLQRMGRLLPVYWVCLALALGCAAIARVWLSDPDTPSWPDWPTIGAHLALLHSAFGMESFTVGAWYVAIDLQLAVIGATVLVVTQSVRQRVELFSGGLLLIGMLFVAVLGDDRWALYFLPAFCAGMIVGCGWNAQGQGRPLRRCFGLAWCVSVLLIGTGVVMDRDAWVVAGGTCLLLATPLALKGRTPRWVGLLERDSYALFLCHYPVILVVGSIVAAASQLSLERAALGLMVAWAISMGLAFVLHRVIELPCSAWLSTAVNNRRLRAMQSR